MRRKALEAEPARVSARRQERASLGRIECIRLEPGVEAEVVGQRDGRNRTAVAARDVPHEPLDVGPVKQRLAHLDAGERPFTVVDQHIHEADGVALDQADAFRTKQGGHLLREEVRHDVDISR